jgi:hypothetical protein
MHRIIENCLLDHSLLIILHAGNNSELRDRTFFSQFDADDLIRISIVWPEEKWVSKKTGNLLLCWLKGCTGTAGDLHCHSLSSLLLQSFGLPKIMTAFRLGLLGLDQPKYLERRFRHSLH